MEERVGLWERGMMSIWPGKLRAGKVVEVVRGPLAVVRYEASPMEVMRWVATLGFERQKKHSEGAGGARRLLGREEWWESPLPKREKGCGALRFWGPVLRVSGEAVTPAGIVEGSSVSLGRVKA